MKRIILALLCVAMLVSIFPICSKAAEPVVQETITYYSDGSYCITTIVEETSGGIAPFATTQTKTGTKSQSYYNTSGELLFTAYVRGTFEYNGSTAKATNAQCGHSISHKGWSYVSGSASYSGATATATCKFHAFGLADRTATVSLTCAADGTLS